jgi:hypothetical protein
VNATRFRLLYLGFAFPPGVHALYPGINPAGHMLETNLVAQLRRHYEVRSAGILPIEPPEIKSADPDSGIAHELLLFEKWPELLHRQFSLNKLKRQYKAWAAASWEPQVVLVYNLSPIYNQFLLWLRSRRKSPKLVLLLLDSPNLGEQLPWLKRFRRRFKPMYVPDSEMLPRFDACVGLSKSVERYFTPRAVPFLWMPGACAPQRAIKDSTKDSTKGDQEGTGSGGVAADPIRFGYYGALGAHAGVQQMTEVFLRSGLNATLEICGYGKAAEELAERARQDARLKFRGLLSPAECLRFGRECDVLVNPRPATHGNENNFASKVFDYALSGRAILTSRLSGVEAVLGADAWYFDAAEFEKSLGTELERLANIPRSELHRRGAAVQQKILTEYSWDEQGRRVAEFLGRIAGA